MDADRPFFATAARGTEGALRDELRELRLPKVRADRGGVHFGGELEHGMRACLRSRIALRVLMRLGRFEAPDADALYRGVAAVDWSRFLDPQRTVGVSANLRSSALRHSNFVAQRAKDAIVDQLRERFGARPDVARQDPDVPVVVRIVRDEAEVLVDLAGIPLHRRGYRTEAGEAPLKEHLAAAILRLAGWQPGMALLDPLCGSGTFCIEAAGWAAGLPAGGKRRFAFQRWASHDAETEAVWERELARAAQFARPVPTDIRGADRDAGVVRIAEQNAARAGVTVDFCRADVFDAPPPARGTFVVTNPPYGVRLETTPEWLPQFGRALAHMRGCRIAVITPEPALVRAVGRPPAMEHTLYNGDLECRLYAWEIP